VRFCLVKRGDPECGECFSPLVARWFFGLPTMTVGGASNGAELPFCPVRQWLGCGGKLAVWVTTETIVLWQIPVEDLLLRFPHHPRP
jgi:hypothetical protein